MKTIDVKSLIIGALLTSTIFLGVAAVPKDTGKSFSGPNPPRSGVGMQWDDKQVWYLKRLGWEGPPTRLTNRLQPQGFEPFAATDKHILFRKRAQ